MANGGRPENLRRDLTTEEARELGRKGGIKSGESRRRKRDAREAFQTFLNLATTDENIKHNLEVLGVEEDDRTNMFALIVRMYVKAMSGDLDATKMLFEYGGYSPDQELKDKERLARIDAITTGGRAGAIVSGEEEDGGDVIIYLPEIDSEDDTSASTVTGASDSKDRE